MVLVFTMFMPTWAVICVLTKVLQCTLILRYDIK